MDKQRVGSCALGCSETRPAERGVEQKNQFTLNPIDCREAST